MALCTSRYINSSSFTSILRHRDDFPSLTETCESRGTCPHLNLHCGPGTVLGAGHMWLPFVTLAWQPEALPCTAKCKSISFPRLTPLSPQQPRGGSNPNDQEQMLGNIVWSIHTMDVIQPQKGRTWEDQNGGMR